MSIIHNLQDISTVTIGSENIENIYLGEDLLWTNKPNPLYKYFEAPDPNSSNKKFIVYRDTSNINIIKYYYSAGSVRTASNSSQLNYTVSINSVLPSTQQYNLYNYTVTSITSTTNSLSMQLYEDEVDMKTYQINFTSNSSQDLYE